MQAKLTESVPGRSLKSIALDNKAHLPWFQWQELPLGPTEIAHYKMARQMRAGVVTTVPWVRRMIASHHTHAWKQNTNMTSWEVSIVLCNTDTVGVVNTVRWFRRMITSRHTDVWKQEIDVTGQEVKYRPEWQRCSSGNVGVTFIESNTLWITPEP